MAIYVCNNHNIKEMLHFLGFDKEFPDTFEFRVFSKEEAERNHCSICQNRPYYSFSIHYKKVPDYYTIADLKEL